MKNMRVTGLLGATLCILLSGAVMAGDPEAGKIKASTCMGCHGIEGLTNAYPTYRVPRLGGQHAEYLVDAMQAYKEGRRQHPAMRANVANLSEQDKRDIAAWFASESGE